MKSFVFMTLDVNHIFLNTLTSSFPSQFPGNRFTLDATQYKLDILEGDTSLTFSSIAVEPVVILWS